MAKMRVFELARELNIPGKELINRVKGFGINVDGNFNVLDEDTIKVIKARMLEPVTRVEEKEEALPGEEEEGLQPRRRRIISARRSQEVHRIQESLGISGPLPEDQATRIQVQPEAEAHPAPPEEEVPPTEAPPGEEEKPAPRRRIAARKAGEPAEETPVPTAEHVPEAAPAAAAEAPAPAGEAPAAEPAPATPPAAPPPPRSPMRPLGPREPLVVRRAGQPEGEEDVGGARWRDVKKVDKRGAAHVDGDRVKWRDFRKVDHRQASDSDDWVRQPRRRARRGGRERAAEQRHTFEPRKKAIRFAQAITVSELAGAIGVKANDIIRKLMALGVMATINQPIEGTTAELIAAEYNIDVEVDTTDLEDHVQEQAVDPEKLKPRPPIVTIMGHVDHGKTTLLDYIRTAHVADREAGGITQHIGAYYVRSDAGDVVFLDTPGHEAFTSLRARGANITDLVVLVVAADDGVMPQTVEAIEHARAAKVPIMVAVNKIDRPNANPDRIKRQLMEHDLLAEEFGGETVYVPVSAKSGQGVDQLLEMIHLQAELMELQAEFEGPARGFVIESRMDRQRGPVASVIVQRGTLAVGDAFVVGNTWGRVRAMFDDKGAPLEQATPATPAEILGYADLPEAGDVFVVMEDEKVARQIAELREDRSRQHAEQTQRRVSLENFIQGVGADEPADLNLVLKADTQGSLEALRSSLEKQGNEQVRVVVIRAGIGGITETDVSLALTAKAIVIGFNVRAETKASALAQAEGVDVKLYTVIYELIDDVRKALEGLLKPIVREEIIGRCEVRQVFSTPRDGQIVGGYVTEGRLERNGQVRIYRDDTLIHTGQVGSLRRFKEDVASVQAGYECGVRIVNYSDLKPGDLLEVFVKVEEAQKLQAAGQSG